VSSSVYDYDAAIVGNGSESKKVKTCGADDHMELLFMCEEV
jgi:hypothetical protein